MLDFCLFRHPTSSRVLLNLGGIANVTALPAGCDANAVRAFDTGPANMLIDALMQRFYARSYDRGGSIAARGNVLHDVVQQLMQHAYFSAPPPKSCGREQFGTAFVDRFLALCTNAAPQDLVATATAFTVASVADAYQRFWHGLPGNIPSATGANRAVVLGKVTHG
jgi:anhydro-N-acetylmuramic acid kinase